MPRLTKITLLGGMNNVGKSSVLDSIFLFFSGGQQDLFIKQYGLRGINEVSMDRSDIWADFFYELNINEDIKISLRDEAVKYVLECRYDHEYRPNVNGARQQIVVQRGTELGMTPIANMNGGISAEERVSLGIVLHKEEKLIYQAHILRNPFQPIVIEKPLEEKLRIAKMLMPDRRRFIDVRALSELDISNRLSMIIDLLKIIEPRVKGVSLAQVSNLGEIYIDIGLPRKMPIKMMGDGMTHLLSIFLAMASNVHGVLLIDEIENGLYYETMPNVWKGIKKASEVFDCQIIATTHSYECLKSIYESFDEENDDFSYVRLERREKGIHAEVYNQKDLEWAFENNLEVR